jgi:hypothetical protein
LGASGWPRRRCFAQCERHRAPGDDPKFIAPESTGRFLPELSYAELSQEVRERLCGIHPSFIGEDYLSGDRVNEVLVFRMEFPETVNEDATSVWAGRSGAKHRRLSTALSMDTGLSSLFSRVVATSP